MGRAGDWTGAALAAALARIRASCPEIPVVINGKEIFTGDIEHQVS